MSSVKTRNARSTGASTTIEVRTAVSVAWSVIAYGKCTVTNVRTSSGGWVRVGQTPRRSHDRSDVLQPLRGPHGRGGALPRRLAARPRLHRRARWARRDDPAPEHHPACG